MTRLSKPIEEIKSHYAVVVIGSGYGGAITASRLARAKQRVCLLERGREIRPGDYPDTLAEGVAEFQVNAPHARIGSRTGLYDVHVNEDINVFVGCGLGGTSLVNANVSIRAEPRIFEDERWPRPLRDELDTILEQGFQRAEEMLRPLPYPEDFPVLPKLKAHEKSAKFMQQPNFYRPPINVNFKKGWAVNHVGVYQQECQLCGDCVSGCNHSAKNTVLMNYLPDATNHGAEIFTQVAVRHIEHNGADWLVHFQLLESGQEKLDAPTQFVRADMVVLAAGTLGSSEILLRSKAAGLSMSDKLGENFTGNGDVLGFGYNNDEEIRGIGFGESTLDDMDPVGPCITSVIDIREQPELNDGMVIEEGSLPGATGGFLSKILGLTATLIGRDTDSGIIDYLQEKKRELVSLLRGPYSGAMRNTQTYLIMTHDDGAGKMEIEDDRLRIKWPGVGKQPIFKQASDRLEQATKALGGTYVRNPLWSPLLKHSLITVHPLGGCIMAEEAERGVVNHKGQVFSATSGTQTYKGLYVSDGSVIPRSLGTNPLLTISALAERCCAHMAKDRGWEIDYSLPSAPQRAPEPPRRGIRFTETMKGYFSTGEKEDFERGAEQGERDQSPFQFILTIISADLEAFLKEPEHKARMVGTVVAPALSQQPLTVREGKFNLLTIDPDRANTRNMIYRMRLTAEGGKTYHFHGIKIIHDDPGFDLWADTTTLFITVRDGESEEAPVLGKGILKIPPEDFATQMTTLRVTHANSAAERLKGVAEFGRYFARSLYDTYGGASN